MSPNRKVIDTFGRKRRPNFVRVFTETASGTALVRVEWRDPATKLRKTASWDNTRKGQAEARAFAEEMNLQLSAPAPIAPPPEITLRHLWQLYVAATEDTLARRGFKTTEWRWRKFELFAKPETRVVDVTLETMDGFRRAMLELGHPVNQVRLALGVVRMVIRWGVMRNHVPPTKVTEYRAKFSKTAKLAAPKMAEYRADERERLVAVLDPRSRRWWRPFVLATLFAYCGRRQHAARHLEWRDIDFTAGTIHWRPELDKVGYDRVQPVPDVVLEALWVAYGWRIAEGYTGKYVFFGVQRRTRGQAFARNPHRARSKESIEGVVIDEKPWTYGAWSHAIRLAEAKAGVPHLKWRGSHGFRRGIVGDLVEMTGSEKAAGEYIGDRSAKVIRDSYMVERGDRLRALGEQLAKGGKE